MEHEYMQLESVEEKTRRSLGRMRVQVSLSICESGDAMASGCAARPRWPGGTHTWEHEIPDPDHRVDPLNQDPPVLNGWNWCVINCQFRWKARRFMTVLYQ